MSASSSPLLAFPKTVKGKTRRVEKTLKRRAVATMDRTEKEKVRQRDKEACRVCFRKTRDVHERLFKSLGGLASLLNSMCACRVCHPFLQEHGIQVYGKTCNHKLTFEMSAAVAHIVFRGRAVPSHVTVIAVKETA
jgi:hypothetical protein